MSLVVVVVVVSVVAVQPARKIATRPRNVNAIRFVFMSKRNGFAQASGRVSLSDGVVAVRDFLCKFVVTNLKALRYFFCVVLTPVAVLMTGRILSFILSLLLTLLGRVPGMIHACLVVNDYQAEHRH